MRMFKWLVLTGVLLSALLLAGLFFAAGPLILLPPHGKEPPDFFKDHALPAGMTFESVQLHPAEGITLDGFVMSPAASGSFPTVILMHGICSAKESALGFAEAFCSQGFRVVAFDSRVHGRSQGGYCTYGWHEKHDLVKVVDEIERRDPGSRIGILGNSMGGAIALQGMAVDPRIDCGVIESTFASLPEEACIRAQTWTKIRIDPLIHSLLQSTAGKADWKPMEVRPEISALSIRKPVWLIHGTADDVIPISQGERIFKNLQSPDKEWLAVEGARHYNLSQTHGPGYEERIFAFFKKHLTR